MSTLSVGTIKSTGTSPPTVQNSSGTEVGRMCRAFVNFDGTGTPAIRASFNVTSITDRGTGAYTVNITNALPDANYTVAYSSSEETFAQMNNAVTRTTTAFGMLMSTRAGTSFDPVSCEFAVFR